MWQGHSHRHVSVYYIRMIILYNLKTKLVSWINKVELCMVMLQLPSVGIGERTQQPETKSILK